MAVDPKSFVPSKYKNVPPNKRAYANKVIKNKLKKVGVRPFFLNYILNIYRRRSFIWYLSSSAAQNRNQNNYLGQLWSVLNPLIQVAIYLIVFGKIMRTDRGITNFFSFLVIGTFLFDFINKSLVVGGRSLNTQKGLMQALDFPRAIIPISTILSEFILCIAPICIMFVLIIVTKEPITFKWLLFPIVIVEIFMFSLGCAFIFARLVSKMPDIANLIPVFMQFMRYFSGVFYLPKAFLGAGGIIGTCFYYQPFSLYLQLARSSLMVEFNASFFDYFMGFAYAIVIFLIGFILFWSVEDEYGGR